MGLFGKGPKISANPLKSIAAPITNPVTTIKAAVKPAVKAAAPVIKSAVKAPTISAPRVSIDKNTGKNIAKNLNPGSLDPTGMTNGINRGIASLSTKDNLRSGISKIGNSLQNRSVIGQAFPNMMGGGSSGGQSSGGGSAPAAAAPQYNPSQFKGFSLTKDAGTASAIGANESNDAASAPIQRRYDLLQSNLRGRETAQAGMEKDALARRFASMGASNSGAALRNSQLQGNMSAKRLGEQSNALAAQQSADQQNAIEAANARNLQREQLRAGENESAAGRALQREQMAQQGGQWEQEMALNKYITEQNLGMAREDQRASRAGMVGGIIQQTVPWGTSWRTPFGRNG